MRAATKLAVVTALLLCATLLAAAVQVPGAWENFEDPPWEVKPQKLCGYGSMRSRAEWRDSWRMPFSGGTNMQKLVYGHLGGQCTESKRFKTKEQCDQFHNESLRKYGDCGGQVGFPKLMEECNCKRELAYKTQPCLGVVKDPWTGIPKEHCRTHFVAIRNSTIDGTEQEFDRIPMKGHMHKRKADTSRQDNAKATECEGVFWVRLQGCKNCCCSSGLIMYETASNLTVGYEHDSCHDWFLRAVNSASTYAANKRLNLAQIMTRKCRAYVRGEEECPKRSRVDVAKEATAKADAANKRVLTAMNALNAERQGSNQALAALV